MAEILTDEATARDAMFDELGEVDWGSRDSRDQMRDRMGELRDATRSEIEMRLGSEVAEAWGDRGGRGRSGGFGGRAGGPGGPGAGGF